VAGAIRDGRLVVEPPEAAFAAGRQAKVPVIVGANDRDIPVGAAESKDALFTSFGPYARRSPQALRPGRGPVARRARAAGLCRPGDGRALAAPCRRDGSGRPARPGGTVSLIWPKPSAARCPALCTLRKFPTCSACQGRLSAPRRPPPTGRWQNWQAAIGSASRKPAIRTAAVGRFGRVMIRPSTG
jgi:hypothetical protein